jgi:hypothetical protein
MLTTAHHYHRGLPQQTPPVRHHAPHVHEYPPGSGTVMTAAALCAIFPPAAPFILASGAAAGVALFVRRVRSS